jgi:hypothetical protein
MPDTMVDAEVLKDAVQLACLAPSLHNSQPWQWTRRQCGASPVRGSRPDALLSRQVGAGGPHQLRRRA